MLRTRSRSLRDPDDGLAAHQGGPPAAGRGRPASPRRSPPGGSGGRPSSTSPCASCCPTSASSASPSGPPKSLEELRASGALDDRHVRGHAGRRAPRRGRRGPASTRPSGPALRRGASSTASCARRSRSCRPGSASSPATCASTRPCSPPGPTSRRLLGGDEDARLAVGWRADLVGEPIRRLVQGEAALAFDGNGGLVLEERSGPRPSIRSDRASGLDRRLCDVGALTVDPRLRRVGRRTAWSGPRVPAKGSPSPAPSLADLDRASRRRGTSTGVVGEVDHHQPSVVAGRARSPARARRRARRARVQVAEVRARATPAGPPAAAGRGAGSTPGRPAAPRRCGRPASGGNGSHGSAPPQPWPALAVPGDRRPAAVAAAGVDHAARAGPRRPRAQLLAGVEERRAPQRRAAARPRPGPGPRPP